MKRFPALCLLTAAIAAVSFALPSSVARAEGGDGQSDSGSASAETVKVWFGANEEENAVLRQIAERFEQETSIAVEVVARRAIFDAPTDLVNYAQLEEAPDIVYIQAPDIGTLVRSGFLEPLDFSAETKELFNKINGTDEIYNILVKEEYPAWKLIEFIDAQRKDFLPKREKYLIADYSSK